MGAIYFHVNEDWKLLLGAASRRSLLGQNVFGPLSDDEAGVSGIFQQIRAHKPHPIACPRPTLPSGWAASAVPTWTDLVVENEKYW